MVAEGIERPSQALRLREAGCVVGQGFLYGRPVPLEEVTELLRAGRDAAPDNTPVADLSATTA